MNRKTRGMICALTGGILWGYSGTVGQYLFSHYDISSEWLTSMRMICAGMILLVFAFIKHLPLNTIWHDKSDMIRLITFAIAGLMTVQLTYLKTIYYSNSATATALQYLGQVLIMAVTCIKLMRLPVKREWTALFLAISGVFLICTHGNIHNIVISSSALFWGLSSAVCLMIYTLLPRSLTGKYGSIPITGFGMLIGGSVLGISTDMWKHIPTLDAIGWFYVAVIILVGTAAAFTLYMQGVSDAGGVTAGLLSCSEPLSAAIITTVWLKTDLVPTDYIAFAMIIGMSILLALPTPAHDTPIPRNDDFIENDHVLTD